ncbi:MAG: hypothetical protein D8M59_07310 [Planctomycetes bacterium]|nr:hypothetical protein [Planctomycetota bacterium]NOG53849.1 hypothetical protein [Planctomycetota bacterium]
MTNAGSIHQTNRRFPAHRLNALLLLAAAAILFASPVPVGRAAGQAPGGQDEPEIVWGVVTSETLTVRNGRNAGYDEIARLEQGDFVKIRTLNQFGWATIAVPKGTIGFIEVKSVYDAEEADTVTAANRAKLYYPTDNDPLKIWKSVYVDAGMMLAVRDIHATPNGDYYSVLMPDWVDAFVPSPFIRKATDEEVSAYLATLEEATQDTPSESDNAAPDPEDATDPEDGQSETADDEKAGGERDQQPADEGDQSQEEPGVETDDPDTAGDDESAVTEDDNPSDSTDGDDIGTPADTDGEADADPADPQEVAEDIEATQEAARLAAQQEAWDNLEAQYRQLLKTPIREAEIEPLIDGYLSFATDPEIAIGLQLRATARVQLLTIRLQYQQAQRDLDLAIRNAARLEQEDAAQAITLLSTYDAIGIVSSSSVYDGLRLPLLYRLVDPESGRTVAYFDPERLPEDITLEQILGRRVGVTGSVEQASSRFVQVTAVKSLTILPTE